MFSFLSCSSISRPYHFCSLMNFPLTSSTSLCSFPADSCSCKCILSDSRSAVSAFNKLFPLQSLFWSFVRLRLESRTITCTTCRLWPIICFQFISFFAVFCSSVYQLILIVSVPIVWTDWHLDVVGIVHNNILWVVHMCIQSGYARSQFAILFCSFIVVVFSPFPLLLPMSVCVTYHFLSVLQKLSCRRRHFSMISFLLIVFVPLWLVLLQGSSISDRQWSSAAKCLWQKWVLIGLIGIKKISSC